MRIPSILCLFNRHKVNRAEVTWDGWSHVGPCRRCGKPMRRKDHKQWLIDWLDQSPPDSPRG